MPPVAVAEFQDALGELAARSGEAADKLLGRIAVLSPAEARAFITDAYPALLTPFLAASSDLTAQWYAEQPTVPAKAGAAEFVPVRPPLAGGDQLAISGRWALSTGSPSMALRGNATRQVMNASRDTVILNAQREGRRWVRQAKLDACGFCKMLASRASKEFGAGQSTRRGKQKVYSYTSEGVFKDRKTGDYYLGVIGKRGSIRNGRQLGDKYHDHCRCIAVPVRDGRYEPPDYVEQWTQEYDAAFERTDGSMAAIARLMDAGRVRPDRVTALMDGATDLFTAGAAASAESAAVVPPVDLDTPAPKKVAPLRKFDDVEAEFQAAIEAGDDAAIDRLADEMEAIAAAERKAAERAEKAKARRVAAQDEKWNRVSALIDDGYDPLEAESEVFGTSIDKLRRRDFIAQARADGHRGNGFDELVTSVFDQVIDELYTAADNATNGYMLKSRYVGKVRARDLWRMTEAQARKVMTEEMAAWFDVNGRITKRSLRESILSGSQVWRNPGTEDFLQ